MTNVDIKENPMTMEQEEDETKDLDMLAYSFKQRLALIK